MFLKKLSLTNFKNYTVAELELLPGVNAFTGDNGVGKTNLLDAIHYLSLCKSFFTSVDSQNIKNGQDFFVLTGEFDFNGIRDAISCGVKKGQKKVFKKNQKEYGTLSEHIGQFPVVMISPNDILLITEGSEERRKFMDSIISQYDAAYLDELIRYNRIIAQRNAFIKQQSGKNPDLSMIELWDEQLVPLGESINVKRKSFINQFIPLFEKYYHFISGGNETVSIAYLSHLNDSSFADLLKSSYGKDFMMEYTTQGIHKDDLSFIMQDNPVKRFASQGQQKSFLLALKLAQFDIICSAKNMKPILLLDDIFEKLDEKRVGRLMEMVSKDNFGQIFITDTHTERLQDIFRSINIPINLFRVEEGSVKSI